MKKLGQAALEFLSTYGFAFLIILVMIGALSYFGVLSPGRFLPDRCLVNQELSCQEYQLQSTASGADLTLILSNNLGNAIQVSGSDFNVVSEFATGTVSCTNPSGTTETVSNGQQIQVDCTIPGQFPGAGEKARMSFTGNFTELGRTLSRPINGEVFVTVQE